MSNLQDTTDDEVWTEPFVPDDAIGRWAGNKVVRCKECGLQTLPGTENNVIHKIGCRHRGN